MFRLGIKYIFYLFNNYSYYKNNTDFKKNNLIIRVINDSYTN